MQSKPETTILNEPCWKVIHPDNEDCNKFYSKAGVLMLSRGVSFYSIYYFISTLLRTRTLDVESIKKIILATIRSTLCITTSTVMYGYLLCSFRNIVGYHSRMAYFMAGLIANFLGILIEKPSRRYELCVYGTNLALETLGLMAMSRGILKPVKNGMVAIFSISYSILFYYYIHKPQYLGSTTKSAMNLLLETNPVDIKLKKLLVTLNVISKEKKVSSKPNQVYNVSILFAKNLLYGYLFQQLLNFVKGIFKSPHTVVNLLWKKNLESFKFGLFIASLSAGSLGIKHILDKVRPFSNSFINTIMAGLISGMSARLYNSTDISMYLLSRSLESITTEAVAKKVVPKIPNFAEFLYAMGTALCLMCIVFERHLVRPSYTRFLEKATAENISHFAHTYTDLAKACGLPEKPKNWWYY